MKRVLGFLLLCMLTLATATVTAAGLTFEVKVPDTLKEELNGRAYILLSHDGQTDLMDQVDVTGIPIFGKSIFGVKPGDSITFTADDPEVYGYPFQLKDVPPEELYVQAFFTRWTQFNRANGTSIWAMADHGGGGDMFSNPYNLYSQPIKTMVDPAVGKTITLTLSEEIQPASPLKPGEVTQQGNYEDQENVKYVKIQSKLLTEFWGTPMYIGANVLLPRGYNDNPDKKYPVLYYQGHWPGGSAPMRYGSDKAFTDFWNSADCPQMIAVTFRDANPFYDTSYSVNSANLGPWGDAITQELIPYLEKEFRIVAEPWARMLAGGSTGGWEAFAMQVFYPDYFGGTWALYPDPLDFNYYQIVNVYKDKNAYYQDMGWMKVERPGARSVDGNIRYMMKDENYWEIALGGLEAISLGQWAIWEAVFGPVDEDGYPARIWDPLTGDINHEVAEYWKQNYDMNNILQTNWATLGPQLAGKIHIRDGDMDNYYLNLAVYLVGDWLEKNSAPPYGGYVKTFPRTGHAANLTNLELLKEMSDHMIRFGPPNAKEILFGK